MANDTSRRLVEQISTSLEITKSYLMKVSHISIGWKPEHSYALSNGTESAFPRISCFNCQNRKLVLCDAKLASQRKDEADDGIYLMLLLSRESLCYQEF